MIMSYFDTKMLRIHYASKGRKDVNAIEGREFSMMSKGLPAISVHIQNWKGCSMPTPLCIAVPPLRGAL